MHNYHIIDSGNTNLKIATFNSQGVITDHINGITQDELESFIEKHPHDLFASCTVNLDIKSSKRITSLEDVRRTLDFQTYYSKQIGSDRLAITFYLQQKYPLGSYAIISAGTFTTIDFIKDGVHLGGYIFPGVQTYLNSYSAGTNLPVLTPSECPENIKYPTNTEEAILSSLTYFLDSIRSLTDGNQTFVTGGASHFFKMEENTDRDLLFKSLFYIFINTTWRS